MADLVVRPEHLEQLAAVQDQAAHVTRAAGEVTPTEADVHQQLYRTHGAISGLANDAIIRAVAARGKAIAAAHRASADLAAGLRAASAAYQGLDEQAGETLARC